MTMTFEELKARDAASICGTYGRYPIAAASAKGTRIHDLDGKEYTDLLAGIAVCALGHSHPAVTAAIKAQADKLIHVSNLFYQEEAVLLAEELLSVCGADKVFFANSGAEANEAAIKLARRYMQKECGRDAYEIITLEGSFHGRTLATVAATGQDFFKDGFDPMPDGFKSVPFGDLDAMRSAISAKTAGVLIEIIQGEGGIRPLPKDYLLGIEELCREKDILFMVDEIQTGMCRTGTFWAHQHYDLAPDIFTSAKPLAGGLPMGAMFAVDDVARAFTPGSHATTFGAGGVVCAAARASFKVLLEEDLATRARETGDYALGLFADLKDRFPDQIADVRGRGLMLAVELSSPGQDVWKALLDKGFIVNLSKDVILRLLPPLIIEKEDLKRFADALADILAPR